RTFNRRLSSRRCAHSSKRGTSLKSGINISKTSHEEGSHQCRSSQTKTNGPAGRDGGRTRATPLKSPIEALRSKGISLALPSLRPLAAPAIEPQKDKSRP